MYGTLLLVMVYNLWVYITVHKIVFGGEVMSSSSLLRLAEFHVASAYRKAAVVGQQQDLGTSNMQE